MYVQNIQAKLLMSIFEFIEPEFSKISMCENGRNIDDLLEGPVCHSGFKG